MIYSISFERLPAWQEIRAFCTEWVCHPSQLYAPGSYEPSAIFWWIASPHTPSTQFVPGASLSAGPGTLCGSTFFRRRGIPRVSARPPSLSKSSPRPGGLQQNSPPRIYVTLIIQTTILINYYPFRTG